MKLLYSAFTCVLLFLSACQSDDTQYPASLIFGEWTTEQELLVLSDDYTYSRIEPAYGGFSGMSGDWSYDNGRILFLNSEPNAMLSPPDSVRFVLNNPYTAAQVVSAMQDSLKLKYHYYNPSSDSYFGSDTTIVYNRK